MQEFIDILSVGGETNSLGRADEVVAAVLADKSKLNELYRCVSADDAWVRMRAADSLEKICRVHPDWVEPYMDKMLHEWTMVAQPSIQWHLAQIIAEVHLSGGQRERALAWLKEVVSSSEADWIVAVNTMKTLVLFYHEGVVTKEEVAPLFELQSRHKSNTVRKKAAQFLQDL